MKHHAILWQTTTRTVLLMISSITIIIAILAKPCGILMVRGSKFLSL